VDSGALAERAFVRGAETRDHFPDKGTLIGARSYGVRRRAEKSLDTLCLDSKFSEDRRIEALSKEGFLFEYAATIEHFGNLVDGVSLWHGETQFVYISRFEHGKDLPRGHSIAETVGARFCLFIGIFESGIDGEKRTAGDDAGFGELFGNTFQGGSGREIDNLYDASVSPWRLEKVVIEEKR
jgi:hypothetical protein